MPTVVLQLFFVPSTMCAGGYCWEWL